MSKYLSNRQKNLKIGISSYTENQTVLEVIGKVGIGTTNRSAALSIGGSFEVSGVSTFGSPVTLNSSLKVSGISTLTILSVGGTTGTGGQYLKSTGTGLVWSSFTSLRSVYNYTATEGQKQFVAAGINTGYVDVFLNGIRLDDINYSIIGTGVSLGVGAFGNDEITIVGFNTINAGNGSGSGSQTLDQTLALGNSSSFGMSVGVITATNFVGNGSGITGIIASGTGIVVRDDGVLVGTASTIDFGTNLSVSPISAGVVTVTASGGSSGIVTYSASSGIATYASIAGISTYATSAGVSTIAGYATTSGISTVAQNLTGSPNITVSSVNSSGVVTASSFSGSNTLKSRTTVTGVTTSITNNGIGNTDITGFKSYALMKVGLSTTGWLRLYTDSASRASDVSRSVGIDPTPGSGVIAEVVTTGITTTQIITPFVMGGNLNNPADTTIYAAITNLSGVTTSISAQLTILQLEA